MPVDDKQIQNHQVEVVFKFNTDLTWTGLEGSFKLDKTKPCLFFIDSGEFDTENCIRFLSENEKVRANRYYRHEDRSRFIVSRAILRKLLGLYLELSPLDIKLIEGHNKKLYVSDAPGLFFNISHSGRRTMFIFCESEVGCDLEYINPEFQYQEIMESVFNNDERALIQHSVQPRSLFFTFWTRKEALIKATAKGIDNDFRLLTSLDGTYRIDRSLIGSSDNWTVETYYFPDHFIGSVAMKTDSFQSPLAFRINTLFQNS